MKCPKCGSKNLARIIYGMPAWSEKLENDMKNGKVVLGGCCVSDRDSQFFCNDCKKAIGKPPILFTEKRGQEDYRDIVTQITFSYGGFFEGFKEIVMLKKKDATYLLDVRPDFTHIGNYVHREMTKKEWDKVIDKLYSKLFIHEWKKRYVNQGVLDGEQWELKLKLTGGRERNYYGSNAFPPMWRELNNIFRPYFKEMELKAFD